MQILEHGNKAPIITCANCNCKYLYGVRDITTITITQEGQKTETKTVKCPECGTETTIK